MESERGERQHRLFFQWAQRLRDTPSFVYVIPFWDLMINLKTPFCFILAMLYAIIGVFSLFLGYVNHKHSSAFVALGPRPCGATLSTKVIIHQCS